MTKVLDGFTMVTVALNVPGPLATRSLADDGAQVIKVEPPAGDPLSLMAPDWYAQLHGGMDVRRVNLKTPEGQAEMHTLLAGADLLLSSSRPSAMKRLGLDSETLGRQYPRLRFVTIVGDTHEPEVPGHDLTYQVEAGLIDPHDPRMPRTLLADVMGSREAYAAALALLLGRERGTGERERLVGLGDAARFAALPLQAGLTAPGGILSGQQDIYRFYRTQDGWLAAAPLETHFAARWKEVIGEPAEPIMLTCSNAHWLRLAQENDLPLVAVE